MCGSGCGLLYNPNVPLENVTCPCGKGYWDVFEERFVDGDHIRRGSASRQEYEAKVRKRLSPEEYTAKIRHQWIVHFLDCEIKTRMNEQAEREGRYDGATMLRATTELFEMSQGDYKSRGTSQTLEKSTKPQPPRVQGDAGISAARPSISRTQMEPATHRTTDPNPPAMSYGSPMGLARGSHDQASTLAGPLPTSRASRVDVPARQGLTSLDEVDNAQTPLSRGPVARKPSTSSGTAKNRRKMFLPGEGIASEILKHHLEKGRFGRQASVEPYVMDGKAGYLIEAVDLKPPTAADIAQLKEDSRRFESGTRTRLQDDSRHYTERRDPVSTTDSRLSGQTLASQRDEQALKGISREFDELAMERNPARGRPTDEFSVRERYLSPTPRQRKVTHRSSTKSDDDDEVRKSSIEKSTATEVTAVPRRALPRTSFDSNDDSQSYVSRRQTHR